MEKKGNSIFLRQLFKQYDRTGIGQINKSALVSYLNMIDGAVNEQWLQQLLLEQGVILKTTINYQHFAQIMQAIASVAH